MKTSSAVIVALGILAGSFAFSRLEAADSAGAHYEYALIRWDGKNTHIVWPDGRVEFETSAFQRMIHPDHVDERAQLMAYLMNMLATQGYQFAGLASGEQVTMRKLVR